MDEDPAELLKLLVATFRPDDSGQLMVSADLSDGQRSLFSLSLCLGMFQIEEVLRTKASDTGFQQELADDLPLLTVFAVEEPENHLSPHYLGRTVTQLTQTGKHSHAQVLLSSHSPSVLGRVQPDDVRYFLGHERMESTRVKRLPLPEDKSDEAFKYVREAVRGFPELYFARLVILGEGPSEEIVLRRIFEASGTPLDTQFISVVPLGGRHVNHFWRLLHGLEIPYLTLLDLDREKEGAGWGRVQYVRDQLVKLHGEGNDTLQRRSKNGTQVAIDDSQFDSLSSRDVSDTAKMDKWLSLYSKEFGVFFSAPLDLDFLMLEAFPGVYKQQASPPRQGPRLPDPTSPEYAAAIDGRVKQVLAADVNNADGNLGATYEEDERELFPWYKYLFIDGSKPVAHMRAMTDLADEDLSASMPSVLRSLIERARILVRPDNGGV